MRHKISGRKFNRRSSQRKALFISLAKSLLKYEQITTTLPKAKDLRPYVEKLITLGKKDTVARRRNLFAKLRDNELVSKVFGALAARYANRNGGYIRIIKRGFRQGDMAPMAVIELVDRNVAAKGGKVSEELADGSSENSKTSIYRNFASKVSNAKVSDIFKSNSSEPVEADAEETASEEKEAPVEEANTEESATAEKSKVESSSDEA